MTVIATANTLLHIIIKQGEGVGRGGQGRIKLDLPTGGRQKHIKSFELFSQTSAIHVAAKDQE